MQLAIALKLIRLFKLDECRAIQALPILALHGLVNRVLTIFARRIAPDLNLPGKLSLSKLGCAYELICCRVPLQSTVLVL